MTYRMFSRNAASSRAEPVERKLARIEAEPPLPVEWSRNGRGMAASERLGPELAAEAQRVWLDATRSAVDYARKLSALGLHKQYANRVAENLGYITIIITANESAFRHMFAERIHPEAQPEIQVLATKMRTALDASVPQARARGEWHLPYITDADRAELAGDGFKRFCPSAWSWQHCDYDVLRTTFLRQVSAGRCARVSYMTHQGQRNLHADIALHDRMRYAEPPHRSPFEHQAAALDVAVPSGNFVGWLQYRKMIEAERQASAAPVDLLGSTLSPELYNSPQACLDLALHLQERALQLSQ